MTFDYANSPWVGDKTLARIYYEDLEELDNPTVVLDALRLSGPPDGYITITPGVTFC